MSIANNMASAALSMSNRHQRKTTERSVSPTGRLTPSQPALQNIPIKLSPESKDAVERFWASYSGDGDE